jgi:predicted transcriptional regulator
MASKVTTVTLKDDTVAKIEELKKQEGRSMAGVINEAVKAYYWLVMSTKRQD